MIRVQPEDFDIGREIEALTQAFRATSEHPERSVVLADDLDALGFGPVYDEPVVVGLCRPAFGHKTRDVPHQWLKAPVGHRRNLELDGRVIVPVGGFEEVGLGPDNDARTLQQLGLVGQQLVLQHLELAGRRLVPVVSRPSSWRPAARPTGIGGGPAVPSAVTPASVRAGLGLAARASRCGRSTRVVEGSGSLSLTARSFTRGRGPGSTGLGNSGEEVSLKVFLPCNRSARACTLA